ncbi:MAG: hypothetical protein CMD35_02295 [Flavobacteriales bacterium]|nr:hypothetical protein [Flavobacteriales bacterium]
MKKFKKIFVLLLFLGVVAPLYAQKIIGYIPRYRTTAQMDAAIEWDKMTDYYYFGSIPTSSGGITIEEPTRFQFVIDKATTYSKNVWLSVGGWGKSSNFITIANSESKREDFAAEALQICEDYGLKGIDIDWEFPAAGQEVAFKNFFKTLYETLNPEGYLVSAACGGESAHADKWLDETFDYIDDLNIMSYDDPGLTDGNHSSLEFMEDAMDLYHARGCPYEKMLGGVAFYSRCTAVQMYSTILNGSTDKQNTYENDVTGGKCYNGRNTIEEKIDYVMGKGGVGILIWEVTQDVKGQYSLLNACDAAMDKHKCAAPTPELGDNVSICGLSSVTLQSGVAPQSGVTFTWKDESQTLVNQSSGAGTYDALSVGVYTVEVWQDGCNRSDEIEVTGVLSVPDLGGPYELCDPVSIFLDAAVSGGGRNIEWSRDNEVLTNEISSSLFVTRGGEYKVTVSATGCSPVNSVATVSSEVPYAESDTVCTSGDQASLEANEVVKWYDSENSIVELSTAQIFTPIVNSSSVFWMGGAGSALTQNTTLGTGVGDGWNAGTNNYGRKISILAEQVNLDAVSITAASAGSVKINLKASDGSTVVKTATATVSSGDQEIALNWEDIAAGDYYLDAFGSSINLKIGSSPAANAFEIPGVFSSSAKGWANWGSWAEADNYGFFFNLKVTSGKECAKVPVNVVVDENNDECLTVRESQVQNKNITIHPNPTSSDFTISNATGEAFIYDVKGSLIERINLSSSSTSFGTQLNKGVYFLQIRSSGTTIIQKIIKK